MNDHPPQTGSSRERLPRIVQSQSSVLRSNVSRHTVSRHTVSRSGRPQSGPLRPRSLRAALSCVLIAALAACASRPPRADHDDFIYPQEPPAAPNGAIYQTGRDTALFENATARRVGDTVTIVLAEHTNAQKSSETTTSKATAASLAAPTVLGNQVTIHGTPILSGSLNNSSTFGGKGESKQSNTLDGAITATVVKRLPNGNLLVRGRKWLGINQGKEFVTVEGVIRPIDVQPDNSISSLKVANAVISYGGKGTLADANAPGLLARFFNSPWLPF